MAELRATLKQSAIITIASAAGADALRAGYDLKGISKYINFFNVMTYDYYGPWKMNGRTDLPEPPPGTLTGPPAPLYAATPKGTSGNLCVQWTLKYYACRISDMSKVGVRKVS